MLKQLIAVVGVGTVVAGALGMSGCAKQQFRKEDFTAQASAVGSRYLPAKIDILMVPDNSASTGSIFSTLQSELSGFVGGLQGQYWDYHVGRSPIYQQNPSVGSPILVNGDFNSPTLPDGTPVPTSGLVPASDAETNPSNFPILQSLPQSTGNGDPTYYTMLSALTNAQSDGNNFLRPDALLAVVVVTNGYDRCVTDQYGNNISNARTIDQNCYSNDGATNLAHYRDQLVALKGSSQLVRFYAVASPSYQGNGVCGNPWVGTSYFSMNSTGGILGLDNALAGNVCDSSALSNVLADISTKLKAIRQDYVYSNIVLTDEPLINSNFHVYKNGSEIPQDPNNGWTYKGLGTVYTITGICDPTNRSHPDTTGICKDSNNVPGTITAINPGLNQRTGYVIQLNGSYRMVGTDTPDLSFER